MPLPSSPGRRARATDAPSSCPSVTHRRRVPLCPPPSGGAPALAANAPRELKPPPHPPPPSPSPMTTVKVAAVAACVLAFFGGASAQAAAQIGGAPPKAVQAQLCTIADVFGKLQGITTNEACRSGCATGACPPGWMPTAADQCSPECGRVFEPFCASSALPLRWCRAVACGLASHLACLGQRLEIAHSTTGLGW